LLNELKGINLEDLHNYTSVGLETEKMDLLIKKEKFIMKSLFGFEKELALIRKYLNVEIMYWELFVSNKMNSAMEDKN
jgi:hypothetical protein